MNEYRALPRRRREAWLASLMAASLLFAACGTSATPSPVPTAGPTGAPTTAPTSGPTAAPTASPGIEGADFVLNGWEQPSWLTIPPVSSLVDKVGYYGGVTPTNFTDLQITPEDVAAIREKGWKAAFLNWSGVPYNQSFTHGMQRAFDELGIKLVATTNFEFDAVKANSDLLNVLPLQPDIIITGVLDPTVWPGILQPARDRGITITMWSQGVEGWGVGQGQPLCTITSYDPPYDGATVADGIGKWYPNGANVGVIMWSFNHPVVKGRDQGFLDKLATYPGMNIYPTMAMDDPNKADTVASALITRYPDVDVIYAPWDSPPAEGIVAAIRASGRTDIKVATMDLGFTGAHEIAHDGIIFSDTAQAVFEGGRTMAIASALCRLGKPVPQFLLVPTYGVDKDNLNTGWLYMHGPDIPLPAEDQLPGT
jgi:ribose transport system substrate-binding protein